MVTQAAFIKLCMQWNNNIVKQYNWLFSIWLYFKMWFIPVMAKLIFQLPLLQSFVSYDPSEIIWIYWFAVQVIHFKCWKHILFNIFVETMIPFSMILRWIESSKITSPKKKLKQIELFPVKCHHLNKTCLLAVDLFRNRKFKLYNVLDRLFFTHIFL